MKMTILMGGPDTKEELREKTIKEFLPYIKYTAQRMSWSLPPHMTSDDLVSAGVTGLMDALDRFEPGRVTLKTFAELRIKGSMIDSLRAAAWIPRSKMGKLKVINNARRKLEIKHARKADDIEVASSLQMPLDKYFKTLQETTNQSPISLEDFKSSKYKEGDLHITECIADPNAKSPLMILEEKDAKKNMAELIDTLPEAEKTVLSLYYYDELTLRDIGLVLNRTESRICQIHGIALNMLKTRMNRSYSLEASSDGLKNEKSKEYASV